MLGEVEPVRAEVADDVRRARAGRIEAPARGGEEDVVAEVAAVDERDLADRARGDVDAHLLDERIAARVVAGRVHEPALRGRVDQRPALRGRDRERLLADDVHPALERGERLLGVDVVRRADVEDVDVLGVEQLDEIGVRPAFAEGLRALERAPAHRRDLDADRPQRDRVDAADVARADDRGARHREARNICVRTSMSSRACSGGVRHGVPSAMHAWKCRSSRTNASS